MAQTKEPAGAAPLPSVWQRNPDAQMHVLPDSGHFPFIDQADRVEELLLGFLGGGEPQRCRGLA